MSLLAVWIYRYLVDTEYKDKNPTNSTETVFVWLENHLLRFFSKNASHIFLGSYTSPQLSGIWVSVFQLSYVFFIIPSVVT